jgi:hypothetical protein
MITRTLFYIQELNTGVVSGIQNGSSNQHQQQDFSNRHNYPSPVSQQYAGSSHVSTTVANSYQSQNTSNLAQNNTGSIFSNYGYSQTTQPNQDERLKISDKTSSGL